MKNQFLLLALFAFAGIIGCSTNDTPTEPASTTAGDNELFARSNHGEIIPGQYIVVLNDGIGASRLPEIASEMAHRHAATVDHLYRHAVRGFAVRMSPADAGEMSRDPRVKSIEPDRIVRIEQNDDVQGNGKPKGGGAPPVQETPWGVTFVGGSGDGTNKIAWIIDSGIDLDHPDLNVDLVNAANFASGTSADDGNGHGTHVAGIVAAKNNGIGVIGVAAGATVVPVRVLGNSGSGSTSGVIAGVDYVASKASVNDVVNMSLGGSISATLDEAVRGLARLGIPVVIAAGNDDVNASTTSPARVDTANVYTISAVGTNGCIASWSNFGLIVDYAAPGVGIKSTYKGGAYKSLSGTSMAAPHVAGLILLGPINSAGTACSDPDGTPDPLAHR
jgi:subtilisin family serine protease